MGLLGAVFLPDLSAGASITAPQPRCSQRQADPAGYRALCNGELALLPFRRPCLWAMMQARMLHRLTVQRAVTHPTHSGALTAYAKPSSISQVYRGSCGMEPAAIKARLTGYGVTESH